MTRLSALSLMFAAGLMAGPALAQAPAPVAVPDPHAGHAVAGAVPPAATADEAFARAMDKMHKGMMVTPTGNADVDFVRGMIPHHQGAIDMARIELQFGTDPELRKLSEAIIAAQEKEIGDMQAWLEKNAPDAAKADAAKMESMTANPATGAAPATTGAEPPKPAADGTPVPSPGGQPAPKPAN